MRFAALRNGQKYRFYMVLYLSGADLSAKLVVVCVCVNFEECPVHSMAMWIHHLLTKVQQVKLMRSSFRCSACLEKE